MFLSKVPQAFMICKAVNSGRNEPTTGEMNYRNIFQHIHRKGFQGIFGMEHGSSKPGKEGELAVIQAYRTCDDF